MAFLHKDGQAWSSKMATQVDVYRYSKASALYWEGSAGLVVFVRVYAFPAHSVLIVMRCLHSASIDYHVNVKPDGRGTCKGRNE